MKEGQFKVYHPPIKTVTVEVQMAVCFVCKKKHHLEASTFLTVHGNICIGKSGGVVGNNLGRESPNVGRVMNVTVLCKKRKCILNGMFYIRDEFGFMYAKSDGLQGQEHINDADVMFEALSER